MTVRIAPSARLQFFDGNGDPLSGGKLYTYAAGSSTPQTTYTDNTGATANANPIILDSRGETPNGVWLTEGESYKYVLTDSVDVTIWTEDNIDGVNDASLTIDEWVSSGLTPTYVSATQFTVPGDQTTELHVGRRLKLTVTAGTVYGTITASTYVTVTTITVSLDSGALDVGLSAFFKGLIRAVNTSAPAQDLVNDTSPQLGGVLDSNSNQIRWSKGADVASAAALSLGSDGNYFDITGTTAITSIDTLAVGTVVKLHFDGALTLTHHATDLILPSGASITTAAGDEAEFVEYATGDWRCTSYTKASGEALTQTPGITLGTPQDTTSGTSKDFTSIPSGTKQITVNFNQVSLSGSSGLAIQLGDSGGIETSGYDGCYGNLNTTASMPSNCFNLVYGASAGFAYSGIAILTLVDSTNNIWAFKSQGADTAANADIRQSSGHKALSAELDRIRITSQGGTDTFDNGSVNIQYQ